MQLSLEHKATKTVQTFELSEKFLDINPDELIVHIGLDTYILKTTKTEKELDRERRIKAFQEQEFDEMANMFPDFGELRADHPSYKQLLEDIEQELIKRVKASEALKSIYEEEEDKVPLIRQLLEGFATHISILRAAESFSKEAQTRRTHKSFPLDYCNRFMNLMRDILSNKYDSVELINKDYSVIFQDLEIDERAKVGLLELLTTLHDFTKYLGDVNRAGKKMEIYEIKQSLDKRAEATYNDVKSYRLACLEDGGNIEYVHEDKFADYMLKFSNLLNNTIASLTDLDKKHSTATLDELELRHYVDKAISDLYSTSDKYLLQFTLDERDISESGNAYIVAYYQAIYASSDKANQQGDSAYAGMFAHLVNLQLQQHSLIKETNFPKDLDKFKKYVEDEYTNILQR